jgi:hypothetical protein
MLCISDLSLALDLLRAEMSGRVLLFHGWGRWLVEMRIAKVIPFGAAEDKLVHYSRHARRHVRLRMACPPLTDRFRYSMGQFSLVGAGL